MADMSQPVCEECGHRHAGPELAGICIGCPCENYPTSPRNTDEHCPHGIDEAECDECYAFWAQAGRSFRRG